MTQTKEKLGRSLATRLAHLSSVYRTARTIHEIVRENSIKDLELVVGRGAGVNDVDPHNDEKFTPLHWAAHAGSLEVCSLIRSIIDDSLLRNSACIGFSGNRQTWTPRQ